MKQRTPPVIGRGLLFYQIFFFYFQAMHFYAYAILLEYGGEKCEFSPPLSYRKKVKSWIGTQTSNGCLRFQKIRLSHNYELLADLRRWS